MWRGREPQCGKSRCHRTSPNLVVLMTAQHTPETTIVLYSVQARDYREEDRRAIE